VPQSGRQAYIAHKLQERSRPKVVPKMDVIKEIICHITILLIEERTLSVYVHRLLSIVCMGKAAAQVGNSSGEWFPLANIRTTLVFTARRHASAVYAAAVSVTSRHCIETTGLMELAFGMNASIHLSYSVL